MRIFIISLLVILSSLVSVSFGSVSSSNSYLAGDSIVFDNAELTSKSGDTRRLSTSLHVGTHVANFNSNDIKGYEMLAAYHFGISFTLPTAHRHLSIEPGVFYLPKGMSTWGSVSGIDDQGNFFLGDLEADVQLYSLEFPLSLLYDINPESNDGKFRLRLGGSIGLRLGGNARYIASYQGRVIEKVESSDRKVLNQIFEQEDVIYSLTTGIEYEIYNIRAALHFMAGQSSVGHRMFGFTLGYRI